jgi:hypothetical protein
MFFPLYEWFQWRETSSTVRALPPPTNVGFHTVSWYWPMNAEAAWNLSGNTASFESTAFLLTQHRASTHTFRHHIRWLRLVPLTLLSQLISSTLGTEHTHFHHSCQDSISRTHPRTQNPSSSIIVNHTSEHQHDKLQGFCLDCMHVAFSHGFQNL